MGKKFVFFEERRKKAGKNGTYLAWRACWSKANACTHPEFELTLPFTVPCKMVLARPDEWETWPNHCSLHLLMMFRRSLYGLIACWILAQTSLLVTWSQYELGSITILRWSYWGNLLLRDKGHLFELCFTSFHTLSPWWWSPLSKHNLLTLLLILIIVKKKKKANQTCVNCTISAAAYIFRTTPNLHLMLSQYFKGR